MLVIIVKESKNMGFCDTLFFIWWYHLSRILLVFSLFMISYALVLNERNIVGTSMCASESKVADCI